MFTLLTQFAIANYDSYVHIACDFDFFKNLRHTNIHSNFPYMISILSCSRYIPRIRVMVGSCDWLIHTCCTSKVLILKRVHYLRCDNKGVRV